MRIAVPKETAQGEKRVALTPDGVKELVGKGVEVTVEKGAGDAALYSDQDYETAGAKIAEDVGPVLAETDFVLKVTGPTDNAPNAEIDRIRMGAAYASFLFPTSNPTSVDKLRTAGLTTFAMDLMPRISRAQSMDVLSSMSTVAGYKAALLAADYLPKFFPMLMTAAGTLPPSRVFVIGAGVAGLQAIATSKRLGAIVEAFDVRPAVKEQIESLGGKFVGMNLLTEEAEDAGGYAKEVSSDTHAKELDLIASRLPNVDAVITTALIPGKPAPVLITNDMLKKMRPGSVVIDLAAPNGGNCESTVIGKVVVHEGVTIVGRTDLITSMAHDASRMYSKNMTTFLSLLIKDGALALDMEDEIVKGTMVTHEGKVVHEVTRLSLERGGGA
ncbi:MAG: Re/Si-specific NAD(P)(+) transhydrogenase subunit alpha [Armatimonadetes bacterium]|nr:Re/Si-specific NAD(P)(+) transhydrogenase subunit alpha [Armatimonadota bacterium]